MKTEKNWKFLGIILGLVIFLPPGAMAERCEVNCDIQYNHSTESCSGASKDFCLKDADHILQTCKSKCKPGQ